MGLRRVKIGDFLKRIKRPVLIVDDAEYKLVTIRINHKGVVLRELKRGAEIKSNMYEVRNGDFILSGIDARNGAFGIISEDLDGAIVTNDFWYFNEDEAIIDKQFFLTLTSTSWFDEICKRGSDGTTQRIRLQKDKFFDQEIVLPSIEEQKLLAKKVNTIQKKQLAISEEITQQKELVTKLKQSILQDAISGKLTQEWRANNPNIEPATQLLKQIKTTKQQQIKEGKLRKEKPLDPIDESTLPFPIPPTWTWCRLGEIFQTTSGGTPSRSNKQYWGGDIAWYKSGELNDGILRRSSLEKITIDGLKSSSTSLFPKGTLLIAMYGATAGKLSILDVDATTNQAVCGIYENKHIDTKYTFYYLMSQRQKMIDDSWGMSQPNISQTYLKSFLIPIAPYEEQLEIVNVIESLLNLTKDLESQIAKSELLAQQLTKSILTETFEND